MAFVNATPLGASINASQSLRSDLCVSPLRCVTPSKSSTRMGYGDYSYSTDKTKGHVNQYYVDKFRNVYDFAKGQPATEQDALVGRTVKGAVQVPTEGIPQLTSEYTALIPIVEDVIPDPRIEESEGAMYTWDAAYVDPQYLPSAYTDINNEAIAEDALAKFRGSVSADRGQALSALDINAKRKIQALTSPDAFDEYKMSSLEGQLDIEFVKLQKLGSPASLNPTGIPQTQIPGYNFVPPVGALDVMKQEEAEIAFWKTDTKSNNYKKPAGNEMPELPYNKPASVDALKLVQQARDIIGKE